MGREKEWKRREEVGEGKKSEVAAAAADRVSTDRADLLAVAVVVADVSIIAIDGFVAAVVAAVPVVAVIL